MISDWKFRKITDIAVINPAERLSKGMIAKKIAMDKLQPFTRDVPGFEYEPYSSGTKFRNGDTIMARITPCLENGKTSKVTILDEGEIGFGSTEYLVFRAKEDVDEDFLYYLICSPLVREPAIKSMVGSSGRQRVQTDVVENLELYVPCLEIQQKIGKFLKSLDDKIAFNKQINQNLYEQIQTIYCKEYDPVSHETTGVLSDICEFSSDRVQVSDLSISTYFSTENMQPNKAGAVKASSLPSVSQTTKCRKGDVLISNIRPYFKKILHVTEDCGCSTDVLCFVPQSNYSAFLFGTLYMDRFFDYMVAGSKGTKMPRGDKQQIMKYPIVVPSPESLVAFNAAVTPMLEQIAINNKEVANLATMRDTLLPRLMSGELDVSEIGL